MNPKIEAIFFDIGNTLRILTANEPHQEHAKKKITELVGTDEDPDLYCQKVDLRYKDYRKWAFDNLREAPETELWTRWLAPEFPKDRITEHAVELTYQYRQSMGFRVVVPNGKEVVIELSNRGYTLGLISNLITSQEIPDWLEADDLAQYFKSVALSSVLGIRKPDPAIYLEAAKQAEVEPINCAYIGDNLKRDVTGTRQAGFGMVVIMIKPDDLQKAVITPDNKPDAIIYEFTELLDIFPSFPEVTWEKIRKAEVNNN